MSGHQGRHLDAEELIVGELTCLLKPQDGTATAIWARLHLENLTITTASTV